MAAGHFRARQVASIRWAIAQGRQAVLAAGKNDPLVFARAFVASGGAQRPDRRATPADEIALGEQLLTALAGGQGRGGDADLARERHRAHSEAAWAQAQRDDSVVGFLLVLPEAALETATAEALSHASYGLGPGVVPKAEIVVLQPECDGAEWRPVTAHEVES